MSRGVNKVILIGNVGQNPEVKHFENGGCIANLTLATTETWKDKQSGEKQEQTEWHRVVFFNKLAEIVSAYVKKGLKLFVEGNIRTRKWQGKDGQDRYTTEVCAKEMQILSPMAAASETSMTAAAQTEELNDDIPF